jgi:hypothetical protein
MIITQRSRLEAFQACPRRGYYAYLHNKLGISRKGFDPDLLMGTAIHTGIESLLSYHALTGEVKEDEAACEAIRKFSLAINEVGLAPMVMETADGFELVPASGAQQAFMVNLVEALVRGFARVRLSKLLEQYEIMEIEREETYQLTPDLTFLSRSDFISKRRSDDELFIHNLKSVKWPDGAWRKKFHYDQQTLSELLGPEQRYGRKFGGVIIEGLVKGTKNVEYPKGSGVRYNNSPLVWAWVGPENHPFPADVRIKYEYVDESGRNRRLGPTYNRVPAYTVMPIREWLDRLMAEAPEVLEAQFVTLPPVLRNEAEIEEWKVSTIEMEVGNRASIDLLNEGVLNLPVLFPKHTAGGNCLGFGQSTCPFFSICWEGASPDDPELYMPRVLNHPQEGEIK